MREPDGLKGLFNPSGMQLTPEQVAWARCRPPHQRTPWPEPGQRVLYRHDPYGTLTEAVVEHVESSYTGDYNVWRFIVDERGQPVVVGGRRMMEMVDDPWPDVYLQTDWGRVATREARLDGSPGWLPKET